MSKKAMKISAAIYIVNAIIWTINFFLHWHQDGMINLSTGLFGVSAGCFLIAAVGAVLALIRGAREEKKKQNAA